MCLSTDKSDIIQGRQCTYNVALRHVHATIVAMEKQEVLNIMSVVSLFLS
jgi:hypothetical protein